MKFTGRGRVYIGERSNAGVPSIMKFVGCADALSIALAVETTTHNSKCTSADALDYQGVRSLSAQVTMTLSEWIKNNLLLALRGTEIPDASSGSVSAEACGTGFEAGDIYLLGAATGTPHTNVSAVTISDGGGALSAGTDYSVNADTGAVTFITDTTGAVTADYTYNDLPFVSMLTAGQKEYWVRFDGVNKADDDRPLVVDLYRVQFNPTQNLDLLPDELALLELQGAVLVDDTKASDSDFGQFGRMTFLEEVTP